MLRLIAALALMGAAASPALAQQPTQRLAICVQNAGEFTVNVTIDWRTRNDSGRTGPLTYEPSSNGCTWLPVGVRSAEFRIRGAGLPNNGRNLCRFDGPMERSMTARLTGTTTNPACVWTAG